MPGMDGLELLSQMSHLYPLKKAIIISSYGDMGNIRTAMNRGAFDFITKPIDFTDLETTIEKTFRHVQQQKETIKAIQENDILKMYVDKDVINFMSGREFEETLLRSEARNATVMFVDICRYTSISERYPPGKVVRLLNKYFDRMVAKIVDHHGQVDKFMGDCVMAVFQGDEHPFRALNSALSIRDSFREVVEHELDNYRPEIAIGVNSGDMVMGNIGSETLRRLDYTVIGDVVNTAQRLQSKARPAQILTTETTLRLVGDAFRNEELPDIRLKNKANSNRIFNVVGLV
jgi:class 3 adenylate cyclase